MPPPNGITPPPDAPSLADPANFAQQAAAFVAWIATFVNDEWDQLDAGEFFAVDSLIQYIATGQPLPSSDIGPVWFHDYGNVLAWNGSAYAPISAAPNLITFDTGSGTWNPSANAVALEVWMKGAGGGGGGVNGLGSSPSGGTGANGNPGAWLYKLITNPAAAYDWGVGAGGTGGATGNNAGSAGGDTTFTDNAAIDLTAEGGDGGSGANSTTGSNLSAAPTTSAAATGGDINVPGEISFPGRVSGGVVVAMPATKGGMWGSGTVNAFASAGTQDGLDGAGYGAPGTGGITVNTSGDAAGGDGTGGFIMVREHF